MARQTPYMTGAQLSEGLATVGLTLDKACTMFAQDRRRVLSWLHDDSDIPGWVPIMLAMMTLPDAMAMAHATSQHLIRIEHDHVKQMERDNA